MSRIAIHPIDIPENTEVTVEDDVVRVSGKNGELERAFKPQFVSIEVSDSEETVTLKCAKEDSRRARALWGTYASHIKNMIHGVTEGFEKKLTFKGIGYQAHVSGDTLEMELGYSHPITFDIPEGIDVEAKKNEITISGIDKEAVGQFAARVRSARKPEPYKGKGVKYSDEKIRRKEGKKTV